MNDKKYYIVSSKRLAVTLEFLFGLKYYILNHDRDNDRKVYSFENTKELQDALALISKIKK